VRPDDKLNFATLFQIKFLLMRLLIGLILSLFTSSLLAEQLAQGRFQGVVKDAKTGLPMEGVSVYISDLKMGANTNAQGFFLIDHIAEGNHLVEISHVGYATIVQNILIQGTTEKLFYLSESIIENNAVIVTGVSKATQLKKVPFQVSLIRKEDLFRTTSSNIIESITKKAGISSLSTGPAISKPLIRGLGYNRVLTINDGVRQEGQQWGDEHGIEIDDNSVQKIEVLKGPASLVYGSDAMAGVINIISNVPVQSGTIKFNAGSNYQTNNRLRTIYGNVSGNSNGFNWNAYATGKEAADYQNKYDGYVFNSKFNEHNLGGYIGYNKEWGYTHLLFSRFNLRAGLIEGERDTEGFFIKPMPGGLLVRATDNDFMSTTPQVPYQNIIHTKLASDNSFALGRQRLTLNIGWQHNERAEYGNPDDLSERSLFFDLTTLTYTTQLHLKEQNGWKTSVGLNGMKQNNLNRGVEQLIPDYDLLDWGGFVFASKDIHKTTLSGGIRFDHRNIYARSMEEGGVIKTNPLEKNFSNVSGSIGAAFQVSKKLNLKINIARAFRAPSIPELSSYGAHEGTIRYEYGNSLLQSEISTQWDGSIEYENEHFSVNLSTYFNQFQNFIFYRKLTAVGGGDSTVLVDGNKLTAFTFDQQDAGLMGTEMTLDIHPHPLDWLHIENTFSIVSGRLQQAIEGSNRLPFMPAPKLLTEIRADVKKLVSNMKNVYFKFEIDNTFKQSNPFTAYNTETATQGYTLFNVGIGSDVVSAKKVALFAWSFSVSNVTDVAYQNHLSRLKYAAENLATGRRGIFNMGRNCSVKINVPLSGRLKK
jgi:iron complex outermembrane receptor protein